MTVREVQIRDALPGDADDVRRVVTAAFAEEDPTTAAMVDALVAAGHVRASLVATDADDAVIGHVQLNRSWLDARERLVEVLTLSPLSVAPPAQYVGVGTALVRAATARAGELGSPLLFLEGDPGYYGRRGFAHAEPLGFERPSARIPSKAFQVVVLPAHEPWMTGRFVYPEAFWVHSGVGLRDPRLAVAEQRLA